MRDSRPFRGFECSVDTRADVAHVSLAGELDLAASGKLDDLLGGLQNGAGITVVVDMRELTFIDSTGLRTVLAANKRSRENGSRLLLVRGPKSVQQTFAITGLDKHLVFIDDPSRLDDAVS
jgi:anti-anti-sigma factor